MKPRLLAVTPVDHPGGAETTLLRLLAGLRDQGWTITLTSPGSGPMREQALAAGLRWAPLPLGGLLRGAGARALRSWPAAYRLARKADIVYLNGGVPARVLPAIAAARRGRRERRPRIVLHIHDMVTRVPPFWRWADLVLAASGAVAERMPGLHAAVVYGPVDPDPPAAVAPWPAGEGPVVGFVGRLEPRKGPLDLCRAAPAIRAGAPGVRVVIVGDEPYGLAPEYTRAVLACTDVEHHPWSDNAPGLMRHLDVLVLPSYEEPFGTVLAEAMAVGTPVVATRVDGLPEVVIDGVTGRLVSPGDPQRLAEAIVDVLAHRAEMSDAARIHAERFHAERYIERVGRLIAPSEDGMRLSVRAGTASV
jgi:glycosyltransferase involved in cell wall biosynthesis